MIESAVGLFVLTGSFLFLIAGIGVLRLPDVFLRMHAAAKASSLGLSLVLLGASLHLSSWEASFKSVLIVVFVFLTTPIATHILARTAYRAELPRSKETLIDEIESLTQK